MQQVTMSLARRPYDGGSAEEAEAEEDGFY
jgi:hypothetical protein